MKRVLIALLVCFSGVAGGQVASPTKAQIYVQVEQTNDDPVGMQFAYDFREAIRRSSAFELTDQQPMLFVKELPKYSVLHVELVSVTAHTGPSRNQIGAISVVTKASWPDDPDGVAIHHQIVLVGNDPAEIDKAAQGAVATMDAQLTANRQGTKAIDEATKMTKGKTP